MDVRHGSLSLLFGVSGFGVWVGVEVFFPAASFFFFAKQECNFGMETEQNSLFAWKRTRKVHESFYVGLMIAEREQRAAFFSTRRQRRSIDCLLQPSPLGNASSEQEEKKLKGKLFYRFLEMWGENKENADYTQRMKKQEK